MILGWITSYRSQIVIYSSKKMEKIGKSIDNFRKSDRLRESKSTLNTKNKKQKK